ncbi:MAG: heme ABC exporter ATP-binding protein CcmA [SAR116 cluster bacterium MED-G05]|nr:heme ABC exporter ATP-binding protein CcmA [Rhodospirillaceae bacterium]MAS73695.1 heme ABC exporter ATP-binding protein CcmA [Rhodospirillaceae bacterium]PDH64551.1 MAG: heme ABC exporter ATP-binding protein CcmA [SAR116 cluster bacterium MED-G05]HCD78547.1 heme ABC exporter ATP-binding protein CcmA [Alphaproteobacteria bacterium]
MNNPSPHAASSSPNTGTVGTMATLQLDGVVLARGMRVLQRGLSHSMSAGQITRLRGPNGSGKSTLLRVIAGRLRPAAGAIICQAPRLYIGHADALASARSGRDNLSDWARLNGFDATPDHIAASLQMMSAAGFADIPARQLSRGQRRRLALARLLLGPPDALWLLDEPNAGLDGPASVRLDDLISRHLDGGGMVIAATHLPLAPTHKGSDLVLADPQ